jgi:hypothetical protein
MPTRQRSAVAVLVLTLVASTAFADDVRTERVQFARGTTGATIESRLTGRELVRYVLGARKGQRLTVSMTTDNYGLSFNIYEPGKTPGEAEALYIGAHDGPNYQGILWASGDFLVQVGLVRSAARRGESASFKIRFEIDDPPPVEEPGDAFDPVTGFHATGTIACARAKGEPMAQCEFGVKRQGGGTAEVTVTWPGGGQRILRFEKGRPISSDSALPVKFTRDSDLIRISVGDERFEVFDAVVFGG